MNVRTVLSGTVCLASLGCITVNVNFPAKQVEKAAEVIVDEARPPEEEDPEREKKAATGRAPRAQARPGLVVFAAFTPDPADGEKAKDPPEREFRIEIDTPLVRSIRAALVKRFPKLLPFYSGGSVGENREGFIEARDEEKLSLKERRDLKALVDEENKDRRNLYQDVVRANKFDAERLKDVQKIFAAQWIEKSRTGWWIQDKDGKWTKKPPPPREGEKDSKKKSEEA